MRLAVDVAPLSHVRTGIGNYIRGTLAGLAETAHPNDEIVAFAPASAGGKRMIGAALAGMPVERRVRVLPFAHAWRTAWSRLGRPPLEPLLGGFDALLFWDWWYPPQRSGLRATMIHDLVPLRHPEWVTPRTRRMHGAKYRNAARTCDLVFVNSRFTAGEVVELLGVPEEKVRVAYPGIGREFGPDGERARLERPYVLSVATLEPRKNLGTLLEAHRLLGAELELAVAGGAGWGERPELTGERVSRLGFVSDERLAALYRGAEAFVYPSRFEGFGIPVLEAMASGVPCVVSSHASLDEACGDAAVRVDPENPEAIADGIAQARSERERLVERGFGHAARFSWRRSGEVYWRSLREGL